MAAPIIISSASNPRVKCVVKLRHRSHRNEMEKLVIEGYREVRRALTSGHPLSELFFCSTLFQGSNEQHLLDSAKERGVELLECTEDPFRKMSYRDRPDGILALGAPVGVPVSRIELSKSPLITVAEAIEKPGNLGTILRTADGAGVDAVIVCDRCTDINNPNVVRASIGAIFTVPVAETSSMEAINWLRSNGIAILASTPHANKNYTDADMTQPIAIVVGSEQYGLSELWLDHATEKVRIPMLGDADSLNVTAATTILLYEAVRQRMAAGLIRDA